MSQNKEQELAEREAAITMREIELTEKEKIVRLRMRDNLYDRIPISVKTIDKVILALLVALVACMIIGIWFK